MNYITNFLFGSEGNTSYRTEGLIEYTNRVGLLSAADVWTLTMSCLLFVSATAVTITATKDRRLSTRGMIAIGAVAYGLMLSTNHVINWVSFSEYKAPKGK